MVQRGPQIREVIVLQDEGIQALDLLQACTSDLQIIMKSVMHSKLGDSVIPDIRRGARDGNPLMQVLLLRGQVLPEMEVSALSFSMRAPSEVNAPTLTFPMSFACPTFST